MATTVSAQKRSWLDNTHEIVTANDAMWKRNEIRFGGIPAGVLEHLPRFAYEVGTRNAHFKARQDAATYLNFPYDFAEMIAGHLMARATVPDFGTLGDVRPWTERVGDLSKAEILYDNVDGVGNQGSIWENFWTHSHMQTYPYGHIFQMVENPSTLPATSADEFIDRPYLRNLTPRQVSDFYIRNGSFEYAIARVSIRDPHLVNGKMVGSKAEKGYYLLVKEGFDGLEGDPVEDFSRGGWWLFDKDKQVLDASPWEDTLEGEIPLWIYYYSRSRGTEEIPAISRPAMTELGNCAVSYMGLSSAADSDAIEAAASVKYLLNADKYVQEEVVAQEKAGSRTIGVPRPRGRQDVEVTLHDGSTGAVSADVFEARLKRKLEEARDLMLREATSSPDSSGESKRAGFGERKGPKLALHASEIETAQTNAISFTSKRWGEDGSGRAEMTRDFDLSPVFERIDAYFTAQTKAGVKSKSATIEGLMQTVRDRLEINDAAILKKIKGEFEAAFDVNEEQRNRESATLGAFGG